MLPYDHTYHKKSVIFMKTFSVSIHSHNYHNNIWQLYEIFLRVSSDYLVELLYNRNFHQDIWHFYESILCWSSDYFGVLHSHRNYHKNI